LLAPAPPEIDTLSLHDALPIYRHAEVLGLVHAELHVLVREAGREAEIERPRQHGARELVLRRAVAPGAGVDDLDHLLRVESCLRSEEHTSELQSRENLVCRLLL